MMRTDNNQLSGRRGLFIVTDDEKKPSGNENNKPDNAEIIATILSYEQGDIPPVPEEFIPVFLRLKQDAQALQIEKQTRDDTLKELDVLKKEHESHLSDLISAHTEFDRALEIFQYHAIPMVLLGPERQVMDANDIFCSIFSVERSDITRQYPPISRYLPDIIPFTAPDGIIYTIVTIKPPIVPFDHEAVSLELLIPHAHPDKQKPKEFFTREILENALSEILLPVGIVDEYYTIRFVNNALLKYLGRQHQNILFRDIASAGFPGNITEKIDEAVSTGTKIEFQTSINHRDNTSYEVWIQVIPLTNDKTPLALIVLFPDEEETSEQKTQESSKITDPILKTLLNLNPSPMVLFDETTEIILANEGLSELIGVSSDQLRGQKLPDIGVKLSGLSEMTGEVEMLSDKVCIESPYGMQCYSGLLISNRKHVITQYVLVLQPLINSESEENEAINQDLIKQKQIEQQSVQIVEGLLPDESHSLHFSLIAVPGLMIENSIITKINTPFQEWTGIRDETIQEYSQILISHVVQSRENRTLTFSSLYPAGLKSYRIISQSASTISDKEIYWFVDQTDEQESIANLKNQIENLNSELASVKNNLIEEKSAKNSDAISNQIDIVEFELSGGRYAMDIGMVKEVVEMLPITPLPRTPPYITGIINLRGEVTHVVDLAILLGERIKKDRAGQKIIIVPPDAAHGEHLGIIVDNVRSVTEVGVRQVTTLGNEINERIQTSIKGIIKVSHDDLIEIHEGEEKKDNLVIWLDIKEILNHMVSLH